VESPFRCGWLIEMKQISILNPESSRGAPRAFPRDANRITTFRKGCGTEQNDLFNCFLYRQSLSLQNERFLGFVVTGATLSKQI
jgi:hypothetical protein